MEMLNAWQIAAEVIWDWQSFHMNCSFCNCR
jgi:hypothetical protein